MAKQSRESGGGKKRGLRPWHLDHRNQNKHLHGRVLCLHIFRSVFSLSSSPSLLPSLTTYASLSSTPTPTLPLQLTLPLHLPLPLLLPLCLSHLLYLYLCLSLSYSHSVSPTYFYLSFSDTHSFSHSNSLSTRRRCLNQTFALRGAHPRPNNHHLPGGRARCHTSLMRR